MKFEWPTLERGCTLISALFLVLLFPIRFSYEHLHSHFERERLVRMAKEVAAQYHLNEGQFLKTIQCESQWDPHARSRYLLPDGTQENSWGIAQWNLDTNDMTKEEALDPQFALTKMGQAWRDGYASGWMCYQLWSARNWE